jgi:hypothetical protein
MDVIVQFAELRKISQSTIWQRISLKSPEIEVQSAKIYLKDLSSPQKSKFRTVKKFMHSNSKECHSQLSPDI